MMQPSTHRIPLPSPQITYRRYRAPIPLSESSEGSQRRGNLLERVWREINETGGEWAEGCSGVLENTEEGVLWVFGEGGEVRELEGELLYELAISCPSDDALVGIVVR